MTGPRSRTLRELLDVCETAALFAPLADGRVILTAQRQDLEAALGISRGTLYRRIDVLTKSGLAVDDGRLIVDVEAISQRINPQVVSLPTERTRRYQQLIEDQFDTSVTADGTTIYAHPGGDRATLADIATTIGTQSRGTAQRHMDRIRNEVPQPPTTTPQPEPAGTYEAAIQQGMASVSSLHDLYSVSLHAGHPDIAATAATSAQQVTEAITQAITNPDAAFGARTKTRHLDALRAPKRVANAAFAVPVPSSNEVETDPSQLHGAQLRAPKRVANAATTAGGQQGESVPPSQRELPHGDWNETDWPQLVAPLHKAWTEGTDSELRLDAPCIEACLQWPKAYVQRAIQWLSDDVARGCDPTDTKQPIRNPGGLLVNAARQGVTRYFPLDPPTEQLDPAARTQHRHDQCRTHALESYARHLDAFSLANTVLGLAEYRGRPDLDVLELMVQDLHNVIDTPTQRDDFDEQLINLAASQNTWSATAHDVEAITTRAQR